MKLSRWMIIPICFPSFPQNSGLVYSLVDATFGAGFSLGPVLGAALYKAGGFLTPFAISGVFLVVSCDVVESLFLIGSNLFFEH